MERWLEEEGTEDHLNHNEPSTGLNEGEAILLAGSNAEWLIGWCVPQHNDIFEQLNVKFESG